LDPTLVIENVTKRFGDYTAVDEMNLSVQRGELIGFLGPNGAGKTTTIRMIMNILEPDSGSIRILGKSSASDVKDRIGYLPEERGLYRKMTVDATLRYLGALKDVSKADLDQRIPQNLEFVQLADRRFAKVESLSKGMQQKLQIVATLLHQPDLVILDEPFSGLDPININMLQGMINDLRAKGVTVIFSTHVMEQAERLCDRLVLINRGRKIAEGTLSEIRNRFSSQNLIFEGDGNFEPLLSHPAIADGQARAGSATLQLIDGNDPQGVLELAMQHARLTRFEVHQPTLQEIFVNLVGADSYEATNQEPTHE
jgi:ABC-2 type transport system ATP-binding protein